MSNVSHELRQFVIDNFLFGETDGSLADETSFIENGIVDSTGVLELIDFLERRYGIKLQDDELLPENLDSIKNLTSFIEGKFAQRAAVQRAD